MNCKNRKVVSSCVHICTVVCIELLVSPRREEIVERRVLCVSSLLESVQRLDNPVYLVATVMETWDWIHVQNFVIGECGIEVCAHNVHLVQFPVKLRGECY